MRRAAIVCALLAASEPATVHAGSSCGGGGGGSSGGSSGGGSSGGDSGGDSSYDYSSDSGGSSGASACIDDTDVHGYRRCTKFGTWGRAMRIPRIFLELGTNVRQFGSALGAQTGQTTHGSENFTFKTVMPASEPTRDVAMTTALRIGVGLSRSVYSGIELELGGLLAPASARAEMMNTGIYGAPVVEQQRGLMLGALGVAGIRGATQRGAFAVEAAGGVRHVTYNFQSTYHHCIETSSIGLSRGVVEARARGELWLSPWLTAGATLGSNVLDRGDWMAGVYLGVHTRAFAGGR